jgi:phosphohistidine swiveling domain-containing protein
MTAGYSDPLHTEVGPETTWSLANFSEAIPGIPTPLGWTFWHRAMERASLRAFVDLGAFPRSCATTLRSPSGSPLAAIFFGRVAGSVDCLREIGAAMPGNSPQGVEQQVFGSVRPEADNTNNPRRYPVVMARMPLALGTMNRRLGRVRATTNAWWERTIADPPREPEAARALLLEANARYEEAIRIHALITMVAQGAFDAVATLARKAGHPGLEARLLTGLGGVEEIGLAGELWRVARGSLPLDAFLSRHGYHGPDEGEISSRSWREDPRPLEALFETYARMPDDEEPEAVAERRRTERHAAERELMTALPRGRRPVARLALAGARALVPKREIGKSAFLQAIDVGRLATRPLSRTGEHPDDCYYLTLDEIRRGDPSDAAMVAYRRERREHYKTLRLPQFWTGMPVAEPLVATAAAVAGDVIEGMPVVPGTVEGRARLVTDPKADQPPLEPGEILVCRTTDPSWVTVFLTASALVIDVGGAISHGAIVARELGIPCVINTLDGTSRIRDGQRIRVDGGTGLVEVLA